MRVFSIQPDGKFREYIANSFHLEHVESDLESWLKTNPDCILENNRRILIIGQQVRTNVDSIIDLLGLSIEGDVVVIELKRDRTPRDVIAQALEYASYAERLDANQLEDILRADQNDDSLNLAEYHRAYFNLNDDEAVAFNKDQRIVIVGQLVTREIKQTAVFLRGKGLNVTCVEFTFFLDNDGKRLLSQEIVVGNDADKPVQPIIKRPRPVTEQEFIASLDDNGKAVFTRILNLGKKKSMAIYFGSKGFSLNVDVDGSHSARNAVAICFVYPPKSVFQQSLRTALRDVGGVEQKTAVPELIIQSLEQKANDTGLFIPAGKQLKCQIDRRLADTKVDALIAWCEAVETEIRVYGLKG